jgi:hypothetical protein
MKNFKLIAIVILFSGISMQAQATKRSTPSKNCHFVKNLKFKSCEERVRNSGVKINCRSKHPSKLVCDKVESDSDLKARIDHKEERRIYKCLKSIATNKKTMGIIPIGKSSDDKYEIKDNSLTADQSKKEHLLVDAKNKQVQKCKMDGEEKTCSRASWSDLKKVLKDNIELSKAQPFESINKKFDDKKVELDLEEGELKSKEDFVQGIVDGEAIKKHLDALASTKPEDAKIQRDRWKQIFSEKLGVSEQDFSNVEKLKAVKKGKIAEALKEMKDETKNKIADIPNDKEVDKKLYKDKILKVSESEKEGKALCKDIGLKSLATVIKNHGGSASHDNGKEAASATSK